MGLAQPVVGDPRAEVVDVVEADAAGHPVEHPGQAVERAARERGRGVVPVLARGPVRPLVLVLHVEEEDAAGGGEEHRGRVDGRDRARPDQQARGGQRHEDGRVGEVNPEDLAPSSRALRVEPLLGDQPDRAEHEQDDRVAVDGVLDPAEPREGAVLLDGERLDVAVAALVQAAGGGVVDGVVLRPLGVGREGQGARDEADQVVGPPRAKEGAVAAVVHDDERSDQEAGGHERERERQPVADAQREVHRHERAGEREQGHRELRHAAAQARVLVRGDGGAPLGARGG